MALQLGGLHSNAYISDLFARNFAKDGMKAYVELIQRKERELGTDVLTHQKVRACDSFEIYLIGGNAVERCRIYRCTAYDRDRRIIVNGSDGERSDRSPVR